MGLIYESKKEALHTPYAILTVYTINYYNWTEIS